MFTPFFRHSLRGTLILCGIVALNACQNAYEVREPDPPAADRGKSTIHYEQLPDYSDPGLARFARKMADRAVQKVHIVQLGDSHMAALALSVHWAYRAIATAMLFLIKVPPSGLSQAVKTAIRRSRLAVLLRHRNRLKPVRNSPFAIPNPRPKPGYFTAAHSQ